MKILIVSFDRSLVSKLRNILGEHDVIDVKNGEEAINTVSQSIDVVIYDAVSGSISEEDINNMYRQKFKESKYIVLVDDLFPVDMNNILPPKKIKVMRDEALEKVPKAIHQEPVEEQTPIFESTIPFEEEALQETPIQESFSFREIELGIPRKKLLVVSFDSSLINNIMEVLSEKVEIIQARNIKESPERAKEADIILFDTISGMLAYRTLMDMSKDKLLASKPYVLLIDELFTIDVESIPLKKKYTFAREAELSKAIEKVMELTKEAPAEHFEEMPTEALQELQTTALQEESIDIMGLLEDMVGSIEEKEQQPAQVQEEVFKTLSTTSESLPPMEGMAESLATTIKDVIKEQLSQERLYFVLSRVINSEAISRQVSSVVEKKLEEVIREQVSQALSKIDVSKIVREEAYRVLKERLSELIT